MKTFQKVGAALLLVTQYKAKHKYIYAWLLFRFAWAAQSITPVYFKAWPVSLLAALRNRTPKIKTYIPEKQNYNSSAAQ